jgi:hypothetical protein
LVGFIRGQILFVIVVALIFWLLGKRDILEN